MKSASDIMFRPARFQATEPILQLGPMLLASHVSATPVRDAIRDVTMRQARGVLTDRLREAGFMADR